VSAEEGIPRADLVEHNEKVVSRVAVETWDVSATEGVSSDATLHDHSDRALELFESGRVVASPICTILLRAHEIASREYERPLRISVALEQATEG